MARHNVTVPPELDEILREESSTGLKSIAQVIRDALRDYFKDKLDERRMQKTDKAGN